MNMKELLKIMMFSVLALLHAEEAPEKLKLIRAAKAEMITQTGRDVRKLEGDVLFRQGDAFLKCQRAFFDMGRDQVTLYDDVEIYDGKHHLFADKTVYNGADKYESAWGHVKLLQDNQILTADQLIYNQQSREVRADGNVRLEDLLENAVLTGESIHYNRLTDYGIALGNPHIVQLDTASRDTLIILGDTIEAWGEENLAVITENVRLNKGQMTAQCQSMKYYSDEQMLMLFGDPEMTEQERHIQGDSIQVFLEESNFKSGVIFGHAQITSLDSQYVDKLHGRLIRMNSVEDTNRVVIVEGEAENTYHVFNEDGTLEGVNTINGDGITLKFLGDKLDYVTVTSDPGESRGVFKPATVTQLPRRDNNETGQ